LAFSLSRFESSLSPLPDASPQRVFARDRIRELFPGPPARRRLEGFIFCFKEKDQISEILDLSEKFS